ncbi:MAG TPA: PilC/PilY family type IV pilus protein, partial [Myxococcota bacterium]|nr:PilC/PilY family type IV pilus protein [Myxococcota bacterium]
TVIDALNNTVNAIVEVTMASVDQAVSAPATSITYFVSNDGGANWERLTAEEVASGSAAGFTHTFRHFGSDFRWRAELHAAESALTGEEAAFVPGSKNTPELRGITWSYGYVLRREYSRSALAFANDVPVGGGTKDLIISSTFFYPGFEGTLRAFDREVDLATVTEPNNDLNRAVNKTGALLWDAGELLRAQAGSTRTIYTALPSADGVVNQRVGFVTGNAATLATHMATDLATTSQVISFIRNGMDHVSHNKLWDVGHSSPVYLGPPDTNPTDKSLTEDGYASFAAGQRSRQRTVFIGTNDGMVHAFNAQTGVEMWAFIPYNLLAKLKLQRAVDNDGDAFFNHQSLVDGSVVVRDVFDRGAGRWRTVLIAGQALGTGREDNNYYFGLDVTDPTSPAPMWEFTDDWLADDKSCSGDYAQTVCATVTPPPVCTTSCTAANHVFTDSGNDTVIMEAENYNTTASLNDVHSWALRTAQSGYTGTGYMQAIPEGNTNCSNFTSCGATMNYQFQIDSAGYYKVYVRISAASNSENSMRFRVGSVTENNTGLPTHGQWVWIESTANVLLGIGDHDFTMFMDKDGLRVDKIALVKNGGVPGTAVTQVCAPQCQTFPPVETCSEQPFDPAQESFECGVGSGLKCCPGAPGVFYCSPVGRACEDLDTVLGQTWSPPVVAPLKVSGARQWMVVFGSGYNNRIGLPAAVGRSVYAIDAIAGTVRGQWNYNDLPQVTNVNPSTIDNTIPGGVSVFDFTTSGSDELPDGYADVMYVGDLEGRLWKIDVHASGTPAGNGAVSLANWPTCVLFDAATPDGGAGRAWAPVITTPAVALVKGDDVPPTFSARRPVVYFGTGGDDRAPSTEMYRFYAVRDTRQCGASSTPVYTGGKTSADIFSTGENPKHTEWIVGDQRNLSNDTAGFVSGSEGTPGQRFWSDPVIADGSVVFFASLPGSIESVNPCQNLNASESSLLYGYATRDIGLADGTRVPAGTSTLRVGGQTKQFLRSASKIRRSVLLAQEAPTAGVARPPASGAPASPTEGDKVFVQTFDGQVRSFDEPAVSDNNTIRVLRWREIPLK